MALMFGTARRVSGKAEAGLAQYADFFYGFKYK